MNETFYDKLILARNETLRLKEENARLSLEKESLQAMTYKFAWALAVTLDGTKEHDIVSMTGISEEIASLIMKIAKEADEFISTCGQRLAEINEHNA